METQKVMFLIGILLLTSSVSAMRVDYFYSPTCPHCQKIAPFMNSVVSQYDNIIWNLYDVTQGSYETKSTPTIKIFTDDGREIELVGSSDIPRWLKCELNEQSTLECPTYSDCPVDGSWFVR